MGAATVLTESQITSVNRLSGEAALYGEPLPAATPDAGGPTTPFRGCSSAAVTSSSVRLKSGAARYGTVAPASHVAWEGHYDRKTRQDYIACARFLKAI